MAERRIDSIVADVASDVPVDWPEVERTSGQGDLVRQFRIIAAIGAGRDGGTPAHDPLRVVKILVGIAVAAAAIKIVLALAAAAIAVPVRFGPRLLFTLLFGASGATLFALGRRDIRAVALAGLFLLIGSPFAQAYVLRAKGGPLDWPAFLLSGVTPESFLALAIWFFAWTFPAPPRSPLARRIGWVGLSVGATIGVVLVVSNVLSEFGFLQGYPLAQTVLRLLDRTANALVFWPLVLLTTLLALPYLVWKSLEGTVEERLRAVCLPLALVAAIAPMAIVATLSPFIPALATTSRDIVGVGLYIALASVIPSTAYLVLVQRVLRVHLVVRRAAQHSLARHLVRGLILVTLTYVVVGLYAGRDQPLGKLLSEQLGLMSLAAVGFVALTFRHHLLSGIDRWFRRGTADYSEVMARLAIDMAGQKNLRELHTSATRELIRSLEVARVTILVLNEEKSAYVGLEPDTRSLVAYSTIVGLFRGRREALCLSGPHQDGVASLLPADDRKWLAEVGVEWLFPLLDSSDGLVGFLCVGEAEGSPFTMRDRVLVAAVADQLALRMENLSLRHAPGEAQVDWENERAMQCPDCLQVAAAHAVRCACGGPLEPASVPLVLNRKFKILRVLGAGGMGVVYLALDTDLVRRVAVKTMPKVTPRHVARLQREARVMAAVEHPNLAQIYGAERWREVPLLVVEYLDGGTLLDGLGAEPVSIDEALDLGIVLADALDRMHGAGLLHRDIKPSNIGYTADGVPKLLDFGLAAMLNQVSDEQAASPTEVVDAQGLAETWARASGSHHLVGTPLYLSPEALANAEPEPSFDLWSLSLVLYEVIAGRHPLAGYPAIEVMRRLRSVRLPDVRDFRPDCPPAVAAFLNDALSLAQDRRPSSAADLRTQLQALRHPLALSPQGLAHRTLY